LFSSIFGVLDFLLAQDGFASWFFERTKTEENVSKVLQSVYVNKARVDGDLVSSILSPADDPNAQKVFVKVFPPASPRLPSSHLCSLPLHRHLRSPAGSSPAYTKP
jgi:hypothetical protein